MGKKTQTFRFAFGTASNPASAVWRINSIAKSGDVYIHNAPQFGSSVHIALHASGKFSFKLGTDRHKLEPPYKDVNGLIWGPVIFFKPIQRELPTIPPNGKEQLINWLGLPAPDHLFMLKLIYAPIDALLVPDSDEKPLGTQMYAKLFHEEMSLHLFLQHRPLLPDEKLPARHLEKINFNGSLPKSLELIRVSKTKLGPSAIIHEPYELGLPK